MPLPGIATDTDVLRVLLEKILVESAKQTQILAKILSREAPEDQADISDTGNVTNDAGARTL